MNRSRLLLVFAALPAASLVIADPALAQQMPGMNMPGMKMPPAKPGTPAKKTTSTIGKAPRKPAKLKPARKPAAGKPAAHNPAARKPGATQPAHEMSNMPGLETPAKPQANQDMSNMPGMEKPANPQTSHDKTSMPGMEMPANDHAGHEVGATVEPAPPVAPPPAEALRGPAHAADTIWGSEVMAATRDELRGEHGGMTVTKLMIDRAEVQIRNGRDGYKWDAQFWTGGDINKLWLKTEGEGEFRSGLKTGELQGLWSHAIDPWFNLQAGVRQDVQRGPDRTYAVIGVEGLAPYWFAVEGALFLSNKGDLTARFKGEYDLRITQKLILQPRAEVNLAAQDVPELGIGSGLSTVEAGLRLRYQIDPQFAPYVGVQYERAFGDTRSLRRQAGEDAGGWSFLVGVRTWF